MINKLIFNHCNKLRFLGLLLMVFSAHFIDPRERVLTWDVFGYYLYLPAQFVYDDPHLEDNEWIQSVFEKYNPASTFYQVSSSEKHRVIKYTSGVAILVSPFFFVAHLLATQLGFPADGFSRPYEFILTLGGLFWALIGLLFLYKILRTYFNKSLSTILLLLIIVGTNYYQLNIYEDSLLSHNFLFSLYAILVYYTINWHNSQRISYSLIMGISFGFIALIRPTESIVILIPLLWTIHDKNSLYQKLRLIKKNYTHLLLFIIMSFVVLIPQMLYWKSATGSFLFYSYTDAGVGFEFLSPHIIKFLFSFRKGWFLYTPLMILATIGLIAMYKRNRSIFFSISIFIVLNIYIIASWSLWHYAGGSYSSRSIVPSYVLLALPLGYLYKWILSRSKAIQIIFHFVLVLFVSLNLFQTWQFQNNILNRERMTREYYFRIFGKTKVTEEDRKFLLVSRLATGDEPQFNRNDYKSKIIHFDSLVVSVADQELLPTDHVKLDNTRRFTPAYKIKYKDMTQKYHAYIISTAEIFVPDSFTGELPMLVMSYHYKDKPYKYRTKSPNQADIIPGEWNKFTMTYMTPEPRTPNDELGVYFWYRGSKHAFVRNLAVTVFEPN
jgi:hypothetical protein